ncbi:PD-(D/E)XK nuclease-like domain-containing protein [Glycomyces sp. NPDC048151]|uniref:PD-(D/E)XK nuclease-like domain-containing protein n=1 Tax=Glycomyces sp. NPDC048151 TaxID=3364002 RepID=UPI003717C88A
MAERVTVTEACVYEDMDEAIYHADPVPGGSLSSTGARALLPPGTPAKYHYERGRTVHKKAFDYGSAAHKLILGTGPEIAVIEADNWTTKDAKNQRDAAYSDGAVPLLAHEYENVLAMATMIRRHPIAGPLFNRPGQAELSMFWVDPDTGVWCRGRLDWLPDRNEGQRLIAAEYKTCRSAALPDIAKAVHDFGYHQQAAHYLTGMRATGLDENPAFVHIFQEKTPPFLVNVVEIDAYNLNIGAAKNKRALQIYRECTDTGTWPGYGDLVTSISMPAWAENREAEEYL